MHVKFHKNGVTKEVKVGFSWTTLFFGWLIAASRGLWPQAIIGFFTFNLSSLYYMFAINKVYANKLVEDGWSIDPSGKQIAMAKWGIQTE